MRERSKRERAPTLFYYLLLTTAKTNQINSIRFILYTRCNLFKWMAYDKRKICFLFAEQYERDILNAKQKWQQTWWWRRKRYNQIEFYHGKCNTTNFIIKTFTHFGSNFFPMINYSPLFLPFHIACRQNMKKRQRSRCVQHFYFEGSDNNRNWTLFMAIVVWQKQAVQRAAFCSFSLVGIYLATCVHLHEKIIFFLIYTVILAKRKKIGNQTKLHRLLRPLHLCI